MLPLALMPATSWSIAKQWPRNAVMAKSSRKRMSESRSSTPKPRSISAKPGSVMRVRHPRSLPICNRQTKHATSSSKPLTKLRPRHPLFQKHSMRSLNRRTVMPCSRMWMRRSRLSSPSLRRKRRSPLCLLKLNLRHLFFPSQMTVHTRGYFLPKKTRMNGWRKTKSLSAAEHSCPRATNTTSVFDSKTKSTSPSLRRKRRSQRQQNLSFPPSSADCLWRKRRSQRQQNLLLFKNQFSLTKKHWRRSSPMNEPKPNKEKRLSRLSKNLLLLRHPLLRSHNSQTRTH